MCRLIVNMLHAPPSQLLHYRLLFVTLHTGIVMDEIKAELQKQRKQDFAMKKILYVMKKNESGGLLISSLGNWSQKLSKRK